MKEGGVGVHVSAVGRGARRGDTGDGDGRAVNDEGVVRGSNDTERDLLGRQPGSVVELKVYRQVSEGEA